MSAPQKEEEEVEENAPQLLTRFVIQRASHSLNRFHVHLDDAHITHQVRISNWGDITVFSSYLFKYIKKEEELFFFMIHLAHQQRAHFLFITLRLVI